MHIIEQDRKEEEEERTGRKLKKMGRINNILDTNWEF
jgi:hypothetical protein